MSLPLVSSAVKRHNCITLSSICWSVIYYRSVDIYKLFKSNEREEKIKDLKHDANSQQPQQKIV